LYSVGVSLYELVTGKRPFDGDSQYAIMAAHLQQNPIPPIQIDPKLPQVLNDAILMSVAKDPNQRFQSAAAFRNALGSLAAAPAHPTVTMPKKPEPVQAPAPQSKRGLWMAIGAIAAALAVVAVIQFGPKKGTKAAPDTPVQQKPVQTLTPPVQQQPTVSQQPIAQPVVQPPLEQAKPAPPPIQHVAQQPPVQQRPVQQPPTPVQQATPSVQQQTQQQQAPPETPPVRQAPPPVQQPQVDAGAARAELQKARDEFTQLENRAGVVRSSLGNLQRAQAAQGLGMGGQFLEPAGRMENNLKNASDALNRNDPAQARTYMQYAERAIETLEKLFHL
jgi:serine/threonine-protein kinase